jgi:putative AdoMet-dependent methyltransferase
MRSASSEIFNHDEDATGYDVDVRNESDPIREAYDEVLTWVVREARIRATSRVLELGSGTGNLSRLIPRCSELVCIDVSEQMETIARPKLAHIQNRRFIKTDILEAFDCTDPPFDSVISTYTVHHLTDDEKRLLFAKIYAGLLSGGRAVFGDLMLERKEETAPKIQEYLTKGDTKTARAIKEEFLWSIDTVLTDLSALGFQVETKRFSDLSWGIAAEK